MSDWKIRPEDPDFRERVLGMMNPKTMRDYGSSVNVEDVARLLPDIYREHLSGWLPMKKGDRP